MHWSPLWHAFVASQFQQLPPAPPISPPEQIRLRHSSLLVQPWPLFFSPYVPDAANIIKKITITILITPFFILLNDNRCFYLKVSVHLKGVFSGDICHDTIHLMPLYIHLFLFLITFTRFIRNLMFLIRFLNKQVN